MGACARRLWPPLSLETTAIEATPRLSGGLSLPCVGAEVSGVVSGFTAMPPKRDGPSGEGAARSSLSTRSAWVGKNHTMTRRTPGPSTRWAQPTLTRWPTRRRRKPGPQAFARAIAGLACRRFHRAELSEQRQVVTQAPQFGDLAVLDADEGYVSEFDRLSRRRCAGKGAGMGPPQR